MFKNTFGCKICKTEYVTKKQRDNCFRNHNAKPLTEEQKKLIENGKRNFDRMFTI